MSTHGPATARRAPVVVFFSAFGVPTLAALLGACATGVVDADPPGADRDPTRDGDGGSVFTHVFEAAPDDGADGAPHDAAYKPPGAPDGGAGTGGNGGNGGNGGSGGSAPTSSGDGGSTSTATDGAVGTGTVAPAPADAASSTPPPSTPPPSTPPPSTPAPLFPAAVGRTWTYDVTTGGLHCTETIAVTGTSTLAGRSVYVATLSLVCPNGVSQTSVVDYAVKGDVAECATDGVGATWERGLDEPVQVGHTWFGATPPDFTYVWESQGSVTVPAGTYADCWTVRRTVLGQSTIGRAVYCRGVGFVHDEFADPTGATSTMALVAKNF